MLIVWWDESGYSGMKVVIVGWDGGGYSVVVEN